MANPKLVTYFKTALEDKPGALLAFAKELRSKNLGLIGIWGYGTHSGQGELYCIPKSPDKFRKAYGSPGLQMEEGTGIFLKGADKTGALVKTLEKLAKEGVNIVATQAIAVGGSYGTLIWVSSSDVQKAGKAVGAK
jgi:hypothetical protein